MAPPITFSQDETFDQNLLPRMAVGLRADGSLVFLAVDGREPNVAPGLRLQDCASILKHLDCRQAMNLDGGSSKRMFIGQQQVDNSVPPLLLHVLLAPAAACCCCCLCCCFGCFCLLLLLLALLLCLAAAASSFAAAGLDGGFEGFEGFFLCFLHP